MISKKLGKWCWIRAYHIKGCGCDLLPAIHINMSFSYPEIHFKWWSFHIEIDIHKQCSDWFMKYIWGVLVNFDWPFKKEDTEDY